MYTYVYMIHRLDIDKCFQNINDRKYTLDKTAAVAFPSSCCIVLSHHCSIDTLTKSKQWKYHTHYCHHHRRRRRRRRRRHDDDDDDHHHHHHHHQHEHKTRAQAQRLAQTRAQTKPTRANSKLRRNSDTRMMTRKSRIRIHRSASFERLRLGKRQTLGHASSALPKPFLDLFQHRCLALSCAHVSLTASWCCRTPSMSREMLRIPRSKSRSNTVSESQLECES
eukprot:1376593-Amorphochlora_amoeboformis.AAC.1